MSVTLKFSDDDAKLISKVLGNIGQAVINARSLKLSAAEESEPRERWPVLLKSRQHAAIGLQTAHVTSAPYGVPEEMIRLAHAFETAVYANESKGGR